MLCVYRSSRKRRYWGLEPVDPEKDLDKTIVYVQAEISKLSTVQQLVSTSGSVFLWLGDSFSTVTVGLLGISDVLSALPKSKATVSKSIQKVLPRGAAHENGNPT